MTITVQPYIPQQLIRHSLKAQIYKANMEHSYHFGDALKRLLVDRFGNIDEIDLSILFKKNGGHKIDYSKITNKKLRLLVKKFIEDSYPIYC